jgi:hypothetical protein
MPFAGKHVLHGRLAEWPELRSRDLRVHTQKLLSQGKGFTGAKEYGSRLRDGPDWLISLSMCLAKRLYTCEMNNLAQSLIRSFPLRFLP